MGKSPPSQYPQYVFLRKLGSRSSQCSPICNWWTCANCPRGPRTQPTAATLINMSNIEKREKQLLYCSGQVDAGENSCHGRRNISRFNQIFWDQQNFILNCCGSFPKNTNVQYRFHADQETFLIGSHLRAVPPVNYRHVGFPISLDLGKMQLKSRSLFYVTAGHFNQKNHSTT